MKKLLRFLNGYKKEVVIAPAFKMLEAIFELIVPLVVASIVDKGIGNKDQTYIFKMCGILILLAAVGLTCSVIAQYFSAKAAVGFATKLRHALFSHIESFSYAELDQVGTSTLITRMTSDINQLQSGVNMVLRLFLRSPFIVFGAMIMAFTVNVKAAWIFVVTIPLLSIVVFGVMLITIPLYKKVQSGLDRILGRTRENLTGARVIRAFNKEEQEIEQFASDNKFLTNMQLTVGRISGLMNPVTFIIVNVATILVIWVGGKEVYSGVISQGEVVALVNYMSQILVELVKLANLIILITKAVACGNRVQEVFEMEPSIKKTIQSTSVLPEDINMERGVEFDHVSMNYTGSDESALSDIHFEAKPGQTIGVIGGTGSGKSTLVNLIPRFYDAFKGTVKVFGKDVKDWDVVALRDQVGMVPQKAVLFKGSIRDNLKWGNGDATDEMLWKAIEAAQAKEVVEKKEGQLEFEVNQ
ncbi:MAG: ABC transporter ATP-binding protein, partial [Agathobacter sp.]|nr:ABC transporter ATP-binding protein [Agathobacter sp.]